MSSRAFTASPAAVLFWLDMRGSLARMSAKLQELLKRAERWPEEAQEELAELGREIEREVSGEYYTTAEELKGIDRGLAASRKGSFATKRKSGRADALVRIARLK